MEDQIDTAIRDSQRLEGEALKRLQRRLQRPPERWQILKACFHSCRRHAHRDLVDNIDEALTILTMLKLRDARAHLQSGDRAGAAAAWFEFRAWMNRPDRKAFDETA